MTTARMEIESLASLTRASPASRCGRHTAGVLLERENELRLLREVLGRAGRGAGATVLVAGEAGIGKTRLVTSFLAQAASEIRPLYGACEDLLTPLPLGPFRDILRTRASRSGPTAAAPDRESVIERLLAVMSVPSRPTVVVVEDAHWADDASLDVLRYVGQRVDQLPAMLIITYRVEHAHQQHPLGRVLGALTAPATERIELHGLSDATVERLATGAGLDPARLVAAVGGNPFFLTEVLAAPGLDVPATVRDAVVARLCALPEPTRLALEVLSVVPGEVPLDLIEAVCGCGSFELEAAERGGMVTLVAGRSRFRHELARRAVESSLTVARRLALHRRLLAALESSGAESSRLLHHAAAAQDVAAVVRHAPSAARRARALGAHHEVIGAARLALENGDRLPSALRAELHELAADALHAVNRHGEAAVHADHAVSLRAAGQGRPVELGRALLTASRIAMMRGRPAEARVAADRALVTLEKHDAIPESAAAYATLGTLTTLAGACEEGINWCRRAIEQAHCADRPDIVAYASIYLGLARVGTGDPEGMRDMEHAIRAATDLRCVEHLARAHATLGVTHLWRGEHREAQHHLDDAARIARDHGFDYLLFHALVQRSQIEIRLGEWDVAERRLRGLLRTGDDPASMMALVLALLGRICARRGDDEAPSLVEQAWELAESSGQVHRLAAAGGARLELAWLEGNNDMVRTTAAQLLDLTDRVRLPYSRGEALWTLRRIGDEVAPFGGCPPGFAAGIRGDWETAAAGWEAAGDPYLQALELAGSPDPRRAVQGLRLLDRLGATRTAGLVRRALRQRGLDRIPRGPRPANRGNPAGLTSRQLEVLRLVAAGLTSAEIAERLYLSRRTVDNHVAGIISAVGVGSRREAAAYATEHGWFGS